MKVTKEGDELVVRIPLKQEINNCYMDEENLPLTDNLIGVIAGDEFTISQLIDLDYKDDQQEGMPILHFWDREEFEKACKEAGIQIWEHPLCAYCNRAIRGSFTWGDKGNMCFDCELERDKKKENVVQTNTPD